MADNLRELLENLDTLHPTVLAEAGIDLDQYPLLLNSAVQSLRGTIAASYSDKANFLKAILDRMVEGQWLSDWEFRGSAGRNDYRVTMTDGRLVAIEMKGCPDGNNINIWERPSWADEFIVWSQCPTSLSNHPGVGVWSGIGRLLTKAIVDQQIVDALVFYDGRCGSAIRKCPKPFGIKSNLRAVATDIRGYPTKDFMPPPCIYLFPRTPPHARTNPLPPVHNLNTCRFAKALLKAFNVPESDLESQVHWARLELKSNDVGTYRRVLVGTNLASQAPNVESNWIMLKRE